MELTTVVVTCSVESITQEGIDIGHKPFQRSFAGMGRKQAAFMLALEYVHYTAFTGVLRSEVVVRVRVDSDCGAVDYIDVGVDLSPRWLNPREGCGD